jgi:hypothetical protein
MTTAGSLDMACFHAGPRTGDLQALREGRACQIFHQVTSGHDNVLRP